MLVNFERIDAWQQRRFPDVRSTPTRWQGAAFVVFGIAVLLGEGHPPHVKYGLALDAPQLRDRDSAGPSLAANGELRNAWREPRIGLRLARWFRR
jgi:hypothetical protein